MPMWQAVYVYSSEPPLPTDGILDLLERKVVRPPYGFLVGWKEVSSLSDADKAYYNLDSGYALFLPPVDPLALSNDDLAGPNHAFYSCPFSANDRSGDPGASPFTQRADILAAMYSGNPVAFTFSLAAVSWDYIAYHPCGGKFAKPTRNNFQAEIQAAGDLWAIIFRAAIGVTLTFTPDGTPTVPSRHCSCDIGVLPAYDNDAWLAVYDNGTLAFNVTKRWRPEGTVDPYSYNIRLVAFHELGHMLVGSGHASYWRSIMEATLGGGCLGLNLNSDISPFTGWYGNADLSNSANQEILWLRDTYPFVCNGPDLILLVVQGLPADLEALYGTDVAMPFVGSNEWQGAFATVKRTAAEWTGFRDLTGDGDKLTFDAPVTISWSPTAMSGGGTWTGTAGGLLAGRTGTWMLSSV
jgi:hypothetical protein